MSNDLVFRRVKGRIIPIRLNKADKKRIKEGASGVVIATAGAGVAAAGGNIYKNTVVKSAKMAFRAYGIMNNVTKKFRPAQGSLFDYAINQRQGERAARFFRGADRLAAASKLVRRASIPAGAGLITVGALKTLNSLPKEKRKKLDPALIASGAAATALIAPQARNFSKEIFEAGMGGKQGALDLGKRKFQSAGPKIKDLLFKIIKAKL